MKKKLVTPAAVILHTKAREMIRAKHTSPKQRKDTTARLARPGPHAEEHQEHGA